MTNREDNANGGRMEGEKKYGGWQRWGEKVGRKAVVVRGGGRERHREGWGGTCYFYARGKCPPAPP